MKNIPFNTESYCNHDNLNAICFNNLFNSEKDIIEAECGSKFIDG